MARDFTDAELQQVAEYVARRYLEVERGLRGRECLRRFLTPQAYSKQYAQSASRYGKGGVVRQTDIGRVTLQRPVPNRAFVTMPARQEGDRWGALLMELRADKAGNWRVTELSRAQDRNLVRQQPVPDRTDSVDPGVALARLSRDLEAARLAHLAATQRRQRAERLLTELAPEKPARDLQVGDVVNIGRVPEQAWIEVRKIELDETAGQVNVTAADGHVRLSDDRPVAALSPRDMSVGDARDAADAAVGELALTTAEAARWQGQVDLLEAQRDELARRSQVRDDADGRRVETRPPEYLTRLLGDPPPPGDARMAWNEAADVVDRYRQRWNIDATDTVLGPQPDDPKQREDRTATVEALRQLTSRLQQLTAEAADIGRRRGEHHPEQEAPGPFILAAER